MCVSHIAFSGYQFQIVPGIITPRRQLRLAFVLLISLDYATSIWWRLYNVRKCTARTRERSHIIIIIIITKPVRLHVSYRR